MDLTNILKYQKIDMELFKIQRRVEQSPLVQKIAQCKNDFQSRDRELKSLRLNEEALTPEIQKIRIAVEDIDSEDLDDIRLEELRDLSELYELRKRAAEIDSDLPDLDKNITQLLKTLEKIESDSSRILKEMRELNATYKKAMLQLKITEERLNRNNADKRRELNRLLPELDGPMMAKYAELRKTGKMPAVVPYNDGNCGACGMDISIEVGHILVNSGDFTECPHCGRLVYKL